MSIAHVTPVVRGPRYSEATLVLETGNSIYALNIGMSSSYATCVKGTFAGKVEREGMVGIPRIVLDAWKAATGMRDLGQNRDMADTLVQNTLADAPYRIQFASGEPGIYTSPVSVARWALGEREILEPTVRTAMTAAVHVQMRGRSVPMTKGNCWACDKPVDLTQIGSFSVSRVRGDSRWGYEPAHQACVEANRP